MLVFYVYYCLVFGFVVTVLFRNSLYRDLPPFAAVLLVVLHSTTVVSSLLFFLNQLGFVTLLSVCFFFEV